MLLSTAIDFYIDDQNQVIPASMAASYLLPETELVLEQPTEVSPVQVEPVVQRNATFPWLTLTAVAASAVSLGMFWLSNQSGSTFPFEPANAQLAEANTLSAIQAPSNAIRQTNRAAIAAPETTAKPMFSKAQTHRSAQPMRGEFLQQAQRFSSRAIALTKTAQSLDDWRFVSSQWQRAITILASVPQGHVDYAAAQQQLAQYRPLLKQVRQKAKQTIVEVPLPLTTVYSPALEQAKEAEQQAMQDAAAATAINAEPGTAQPTNNPPMDQPTTGQATTPQ